VSVVSFTPLDGLALNSIRVTPEQKRAIQRAALACGLPVAEWLRVVCRDVHTLGSDLGLPPKTLARLLALAAAGVSDLAPALEEARNRHLARVAAKRIAEESAAQEERERAADLLLPPAPAPS
jgi:uncharacterized membrane protein